MAFLGRAGDTSEVSEDEMNQKRSAGVLPAGWYRCALIEDEAKPYGWGTGLNMQFQVLTGDYENRRIFKFLCLEHTNEKTQHIARIQLKEFATAAGSKNVDAIEDTTPLYNKPIMIQVYRGKEENEKYAEEDGKRTEIGQFMSVERWKDECSDEEMPGVTKKKAAPPVVVPNNSPAPENDDIPF